MEYEVTSMRRFAHLSMDRIPDETTILNFRHLLESNDLAPEILRRVNAHLTRKDLQLRRGSIVDATIIAAHPARPRTPTASVIPRCTRPRRETSGTSA